MLKKDRDKLIQFFIRECNQKNIPLHLVEGKKDENRIEDKKILPGKKASKVTLPKVPTAAELLDKDPSELNPPSDNPMYELPGGIPEPPEYDDKSGTTPPESPSPPPAESPAPAPSPPPAISPSDPNAMGADPNAMGADPNAMGADPNAMGADPNAMGADPNAMIPGMEPEEPLDPTQIGQVYIMKKIYARLLSIDDNLNQYANPEFDDLKEKCKESIELFQSVVTNFDQFKDKLNDVIQLFQKLLVNFVEKMEEIINKGDEIND